MSAKRFSTPSAPSRTCSSTAADCADGYPPCSAATSGGCGWPTRWPSRLPGTPVLFYGEEIGMAENLRHPRPTRRAHADAVDRRPTTAASPRPTKRRLTRPLPDGLYGPERVNAADQRHDHQSFWWFMRNLIYTYRQQPEIGWSTVEVFKQPNRGGAWPTYAARNRGGRWSRCTTSARTAASCRSSSQAFRRARILVDLLDGLTEHKLDAERPDRDRP